MCNRSAYTTLIKEAADRSNVDPEKDFITYINKLKFSTPNPFSKNLISV